MNVPSGRGNPAREGEKSDLGRFETALLNLVANARDAMPRGGRAVITTTSGAESADAPRALARAHVCIAVSDDGDGMAPELHARVFERFFTTKPAGLGTGLGLPAVQAFVVESGGHLSLHSELGTGTEVRLCLPRATPRSGGPDGEPSASGPLPRGSERILAVEDDDAVRRTIRLVLERQGYEVVDAASGEAALRIVETADFDLLITDVVLRGLSGSGLVAGVRAMGRRMRFLFLSGHSAPTIDFGSLRDQFAPFVRKPLDPGAFLRQVRALLDTPVSG